MLIGEIMSREVRIARPTDNLLAAAKLMATIDSGVLPVGENDRLVGILTDRDIIIRAVAEGRVPAHCRVGDIMSRDVKFVFEDQDTSDL